MKNRPLIKIRTLRISFVFEIVDGEGFDEAIVLVRDGGDSLLPSTDLVENFDPSIFVGVELGEFVLFLKLSDLVQEIVPSPRQLEIEEEIYIFILTTFDGLGHLIVG